MMRTRKMLSFLLALLMLLSLTSTAFAGENGQMNGNDEKTAAEDTAPFTFTLYERSASDTEPSVIKEYGEEDLRAMATAGELTYSFNKGEETVQVSYLGPEGTYTEEAAQFWFRDGETLNPKATVNDAVADVLSGDADFAVIPQENTLGGTVVNYVDALIAAEDAYVVGEVVLPINQTLMGVPGAALEDIKTVYSHPQGLAQSAEWRSEHLPDAKAVEMPSTAAAASSVAKKGDISIAAIAAPGAAPLYGLEVLAENVQITDANRTRFYVLSGRPSEDESLTHAVFVATCEGSRIDDIILALHDAGLEIVSLHDRPEGSRLGLYHFVIEVEDEAGITDAQVEAISSLEGVRFAGRFNAVERSGEPGYKLEKVVVLSRHNIRSPLSGSGSMLGDITPHEWFEWTSDPSELSLRGETLETMMGQYFRQWLEDEGLFPENYMPEEDEVRFYANAKQRTQATARYFSAGLLPVAVAPIERNAEYDTMDEVFNPAVTLLNDEYENDAIAQIAEMGGDAGLEGIHAKLMDAIKLLMDVTDMEESEAYQSGRFGNLLEGETAIQLELGLEPGMTGPIKTATSVADALTFQYYEMADDKAAAFGHDLTRDDWLKIHSIVDIYTEMLFGNPLVAVNIAHPLLQEIFSEMTTDGRKFSFLCGHDSNIASVLAALGVEEYELPDTIEPRTPIGAKLVFEIRSSEDGESYAKVRLVYQSTEQLRGMTMLSPDNPPVSFDIDLLGLERNTDGYYRLDDVLECFRNAIGAYDVLCEKYSDEDATVSEKAGSVDFAEVFPSWNPDSASLNELVAFVSDCTDESSEGYLDPADRIATFDMDGTILCEKAPIYLDWCLTFHRVLDDPTYNATEEERTAMEEAREVAYTEGNTYYGEGLSKDDLVSAAFAGMTLEEFRSYVNDFADNEDAVGFEGMTYGESFYKPMIEVINYLKANDFDVWMVSACEREVVRALMERFDFPYDHVVATDVPYVASGKGDEPADEYNMGSDEVLLLGNQLDPVECGKSGKPAAIAREIGKRPVLAFGNSTGDYSMLNYAEGNPDHEGKGFFIVCDDTEREYGSAEKAAVFYSEADAQGWTAISMANDWATIYGEGVQKTELPGVEESLEQAA